MLMLCMKVLRQLGMRLRLASLLAAAATVVHGAPGGPDADARLIGVQVIFRHGARTPVFEVPADGRVVPEAVWDAKMTSEVAHTTLPFAMYDLSGRELPDALAEVQRSEATRPLRGGARSGQLTRRGQEDMFQLGRRLRARYVDQLGFISDTFESQQVYCRSTRYNRTIGSLRCVLAGMFGSSESGNGSRVHLSDLHSEVLLPNRRSCPWVAKRLADFAITNGFSGAADTRERVTQLLGPDALIYKKKMADGSVRTTSTRLHGIRDDFVSRVYHGLPVSDEIRGLLPQLDRVCGYEMAYDVLGPEKTWHSIGLKAATGPMCKLILDNIAGHLMADLRTQRLHLYCTHDHLLLPLLIALDQFDGLWPKYGADLVIELFETTQRNHFVVLYYCGKKVAKMPLEEFRKRLEAVATTPEEHYHICRQSEMKF